MADNLQHPHNRSQMVTIDVLPDDALLEIFDFYLVEYQALDYVEIAFLQYTKAKIEWWQSLVHVCRRWRGLVFASPRHLNLQLYCTTRTPARATLDVWPALPLLIQGGVTETTVDNVIALLDNADRICQIDLECHISSQIEKLRTTMQVPFPELLVIYLSFRGSSYVSVLPDSFLGGSAPRLRSLTLVAVPFPGLTNLLSCTTHDHLSHLHLRAIPHSGYISPEAMATCLSMLTSLQTLQIEFESPESCPDQEDRHSPPPTHSILPTLAFFWFKGVNEYLEELVSRIDAPRLLQLRATFFNDIDFDTPEFIRFVNRSLTFKAFNEAHVSFDSRAASVILQPQVLSQYVKVEISCREPDWQLSSLAQICTSSLPLLSTTENLYICEHLQSQLDWKDGIENAEWLELLLPFTAVKDLYLSKQFAPRIGPALQELTGGRRTEVLPTLQNIFLEEFKASEPVHEGIGQFISARQFTNRPVAISVWKKDSK